MPSYIQIISYLQAVHDPGYFNSFSKMTYTPKILNLLVLCFYVLSSLAKKIDGYSSPGIYMDQYKVVEINNIKYQQYEIFDAECEKKEHVKNFKQENKSNIKTDMKSSLQRNITKIEKNYKTIKRFIEDHFPALYPLYNISRREELKIKDILDNIDQSANKVITTEMPTVLPIYFSGYKELLAISKPTLRTYIQMADLLPLISELDQLIVSEPKLDSTLNLLNKLLIMTELSDNLFLLVAKRYVASLRLRNDFDSIIDLQMKIVERFPLSLGELSKLGEMQYAVGHKSDVQGAFERILELDQYIVENVESDPIFASY